MRISSFSCSGAVGRASFCGGTNGCYEMRGISLAKHVNLLHCFVSLQRMQPAPGASCMPLSFTFYLYIGVHILWDHSADLKLPSSF
jgi:hypothetical protein